MSTIRGFHCIDLLLESSGPVEVVSPHDGHKLKQQLRLENVLTFITGAPAEPPLGFIPQPCIRFHSSSVFPIANTCTNTLHLPLQQVSLQTFKYNILYGICNSIGFGRV